MTVHRQTISILGATGSIGLSTLDILAQHQDKYQVYALTAFSQLDALLHLCRRFRPRYVVLANPQHDGIAAFKHQLASEAIDTVVLIGADALELVASDDEVDTVVAAIVGAAGLPSSLAAAAAGKKILLANKESLVMAGALFMQTVRDHQATLLPIDSEHNAIFQCLPQSSSSPQLAVDLQQVKRLILTASGGPFRQKTLQEMSSVSVAEAVAHPNWSMGKKISIDSATMMNKGLELIEACWLFGLDPDSIDIVVHPESVIHSMVQFVDGSTLAQMGNPDMRTPIANALAWPNRISVAVPDLSLTDIAKLHFEQPDYQRFPNLSLAAQAFKCGGAAPAILNACNEVAVDAFLQDGISFTQIAQLNAHLLDSLAMQTDVPQFSDLEGLMAIDSQVRQTATQIIQDQSLWS
ncbi:MAG: 1-deoxy-D-xylulose-5-phosphate reductoisomerase [Pseudomonadales bacterium]|nr:1-deoxy-D-xylulose-5-phosphate reductoisomerase [Pseudomonadales bacterium]